MGIIFLTTVQANSTLKHVYTNHLTCTSRALGSVSGDQAPGLILGRARAPAPRQPGNLGRPILIRYRNHPSGTTFKGEPQAWEVAKPEGKASLPCKSVLNLENQGHPRSCQEDSQSLRGPSWPVSADLAGVFYVLVLDSSVGGQPEPNHANHPNQFSA